MKIICYRKIQNNEYELTLEDNKRVNLYDDIIIKHELLLKKEIDSNSLKLIVNENNQLEAYYLALKYLSRKMRSVLEIDNYLKKQNFNKISRDFTINKLQKEKYLDDIKFMESYINDQYNLTNNGPERIKQNLIKLGIKEKDIIINKEYDSKLDNLIKKKSKANHKLSTKALKTNIYNYLISLGYPRETFIDKLDIISASDASLIKKDYNKLLRKFSNKYKKPKLDLILRQKLYQKGYSNQLINDIIKNEEEV
ncbi:MAG: RecX family transcriptional regulator [Bacilli bacterium]|nr:RecX family transcriptional regulator [Bacilli bacterium]MDD4795684.1 RecX family transcriptional regulator [Bacilli bacterium]